MAKTHDLWREGETRVKRGRDREQREGRARAKKGRAKRGRKAERTGLATVEMEGARQSKEDRKGKGKGKRIFIFRIVDVISKALAYLILCQRHAIHRQQRHKFFSHRQDFYRQKPLFAYDSNQPSAETHVCRWIKMVASANDAFCWQINKVASAYDPLYWRLYFWHL